MVPNGIELNDPPDHLTFRGLRYNKLIHNSKNTFFGGTVQTTGFNILYPLDDSTQQ